jgi:hypothetical protein
VLSRLQAPEREGVRDAGERLDGSARDARELLGVAEVLRPGPPGREDEVLPGLLRDLRVGLADLALEDVGVDANVEGYEGVTSSTTS